MKDQRFHFLGAVALPMVLMLTGPLWLPSGWLNGAGALLALFMWWVVGCLGVTVGLHRLYTHRSFTTTPGVRYILGGLGSMAAQGHVIYWTALHRCHHTLSDQPGDPHSPATSARPHMGAMRAFLVGHIGWVARHDVPKPTRFALELLADPVAQRLVREYRQWVLAGWLMPGAIYALLLNQDGNFGSGLLIGAWWGGALRVALGHHVIWCINSVCHTWGRRVYVTQDNSRNNAWLALLSWGESWHNNHHHTPTAARLGHTVWQLDVGWWCIAGLKAVGLARDVR